MRHRIPSTWRAGNGVARSAVDEQALQRAEQPLGAARQARQLDEPVREWKPGASGARVARARSASRSDPRSRSAARRGQPSSSSRCSAHRRRRVSRTSVGVAADDVHLGVVEERVLVEVRGADREPRVVDDAHLRVDVDGVAERAVARVDRAREQPPGAAVGLDQLGSMPRVSSAPVFGFAGSSSTSRKSSDGGRRSFSAQDLRDLGRPEELVLQVDERPRRAQRTEVRVEDPELPARHRRVDALGNGADDLDRAAAGMPAASGRARGARRSPRRQRMRKCAATSATAGPSRRAATSCQPSVARAMWWWLSNRSPPSRLRSMPPTIRDAVVDHDRLLVVAVHAGARVASRAYRTRVPRQSSSMPLRTVARVGRKSGSGAPRPREHADVDTLRELGEQVAEHDRASSRARARSRARSASRRDGRARLRRRGRLHPRQPPARRRSAPRASSPGEAAAHRGPVAPLRGECAFLPEPREPAAVVRGDRLDDRRADALVDARAGRRPACRGRREAVAPCACAASTTPRRARRRRPSAGFTSIRSDFVFVRSPPSSS